MGVQEPTVKLAFCFKGGLCAIGVQFILILELGDPSFLRLHDLFQPELA